MANYNKKSQAETEGKGKKALIIVCIVLVLALMIGVQVYTRLSDSGFFMRQTVAVQSDNYEVDGAMMTYFYNLEVNQYSSYASYLGIDTSTSLKLQDCSISDGTWYDYFMDLAKDYVAQVLELCEAAHDNGVELDDDDYDSIDESIASLKSSAKSSGYSNLKTYLFYQTGAHLNEKDIKNVSKLTTLASKYYNIYQEELENSITTEDCETYYTENQSSFDGVDIYKYTIYASDFEETDDDGNVTNADEAAATAKSYADALAASQNAEEYIAEVTAIETAEGTEEPEEVAEGTLYTHVLSTSSTISDVSDWAWSANVGELNYVETEDGSEYSIYLLASTPYRLEQKTRSFRHILFNADNYDDDDACYAAASDVYATWEADGFSLDSFITLCAEYSDDSEDGLYEDVSEGDMVSGIDDWLFDSSRVAGDHDLVETTYGWHIVYYVGESDVSEWESAARSDIESEKQQELLDSYADKVIFDLGVISQLG